MHPQYSFISLQSFVRLTLHFIPLQALSFLSLHSSSIMSAALSVFSGCSFAQPLGLAPLREKRHFALNQGTPPLTSIFSPPFHARSATLHFAKTTFRFHPAVPVRLPQHRHGAPRKKNSVKTPFFFTAVLGGVLKTRT